MKPFLSSSVPLPPCETRVKPIRLVLSACHPPASCPTISPGRPRGLVSAINVAMQQVPADIWAAFGRRLGQAQVPPHQHPDYHKWVRSEGEKLLVGDVTQGGARSSLALGYYQAIPTGFLFGSLRSHEDKRTASATRRQWGTEKTYREWAWRLADFMRPREVET